MVLRGYVLVLFRAHMGQSLAQVTQMMRSTTLQYHKRSKSHRKKRMMKKKKKRGKRKARAPPHLRQLALFSTEKWYVLLVCIFIYMFEWCVGEITRSWRETRTRAPLRPATQLQADLFSIAKMKCISVCACLFWCACVPCVSEGF